ncbi:MAG: hypothetical protein K0R66_582 [Gammaproteobacteria bacterium]|jgi:intracellular multiplication protein IcmK|nr:hypothetical protein [Gammaproteobacteria bacterium]
MKKLKYFNLAVWLAGFYSMAAIALPVTYPNSYVPSAPNVSLPPSIIGLPSQQQAPSTATSNNTAVANQATTVTNQGASDQAFQQLLNNTFPLTAQQIQEYKDTAAAQQEASSLPPGTVPANGTSSIIPVTVKPGGLMPVIRVGQGMITSLVFIDSTGQVWPITSYSIGDSQSFNVQWDKKSGVLMVQGQKLYAQTNIGVMLQGMQIPVMLNLIVGQKEWDYLDYIQMDQSQNGSAGIPQPSQAPGYLVDLLNGLPPQGAEQLTVSDSSVQLWSYNDDYIMLTHATLLSPAWISRADGPGTTPLHAYELPVAPYILISNQGNVERVQVVENDNANS